MYKPSSVHLKQNREHFYYPRKYLVLRFGVFFMEPLFFFFFFFFGHTHGVWNFLGQGSHSCYSGDPSHCRDSAGSLTCCVTRELLCRLLFIYLFFNLKTYTWFTIGVNFQCSTKSIWFIFRNLFHDGLSQDTDHSSLCCMAGPCSLFIPYILLG